MSRRVLLLLPTTTYKARDLLEAAERLAVEVVVGSDRRQALERTTPGHTVALDFSDPERGVRQIVALHRSDPFRAVLGVDDESCILAAMAGEALGLRHNPVAAVRAARNKHETRCLQARAGLRCPGFRKVPLGAPPAEIAREVGYPCVLKPLSLGAGRGVLRADDPHEFVRSFRRIEAILRDPETRRGNEHADHLLVEDYLPGAEVALEGLLVEGRLRALALFDKPDPLCGPTFEETIYVTPSGLPETTRSAVFEEAQDACRALGLRAGPVHVELRLHRDRPWLIEAAARSIGGLCSRALRFGAGISLEELILRHALGMETEELQRERRPSGVMMIPIPRAGVLREVRGLEAARAVEGIEEVTLSTHRGAELVPLPEGHRYLGFIFARASTPTRTEAALREAHSRLEFSVEPAISRAGSTGSRRRRDR